MKERGNIVKISEIAEAVDGRVVCGESYPAGWQEREIEFGFSSDLMSETIRTAAIADIACVLLVRNKHATGDMKSLAAEYGMVLIESGISMFRASALLHDRGLKPVY